MKNIFEKRYNPKKFFLVTTEIISGYNNGSGARPLKSITQYYLATKKGEEFYELFFKVKLQKKNSSKVGSRFLQFDIPFITRVEPMTDYVKNEKEKITLEDLFYFITDMNIKARLKNVK